MGFPAKRNLTVRQGADFDETYTWYTDYQAVPPVVRNLTGWSARMQARHRAYSTATIVDLASGGGITLGGTAGTIRVQIGHAATDAMAAGVHVYDLELVEPSGKVWPFLAGSFIVEAEVTR